jgi:hypothetical protein
MHLQDLSYFLLAAIATGVAADPQPPPSSPPGPFPVCRKYTDIDPKWSMQFYSHNGCTGSIDTENKGTGRFSYTQPNGITANQCYYFADPSSSSKPKKIGSFHGIANGKYTISWYRGKDCSSKNKIASSSKGKYVKLDKADKPPLGFISFRVSHADTKGPLGREVFCG